MFKKLTNEAKLTFRLKNEGPLLINIGNSAKIHHSSDMSFVTTMRNGIETVYLPGSSIKGVFRSRYEQIMRSLDGNVCDTFDSRESKTCNKKIRAEENKPNVNRHLDGAERYALCCEACKLFGSLVLGGRIGFFDAYPVGQTKLGTRNGVGVDRITGGAVSGALYDIEALEDGTFEVSCKLINFKLYQLRVILWILQDINDGLVTFGMGGSRGNGQMRIAGDVTLEYRKYSDNAEDIEGTPTKEIFGSKLELSGLDDIIATIKITPDDLKNAIKVKAA